MWNGVRKIQDHMSHWAHLGETAVQTEELLQVSVYTSEQNDQFRSPGYSRWRPSLLWSASQQKAAVSAQSQRSHLEEKAKQKAGSRERWRPDADQWDMRPELQWSSLLLTCESSQERAESPQHVVSVEREGLWLSSWEVSRVKGEERRRGTRTTGL
jgi:hypothetical protein